MEPRTHLSIDRRLCGEPLELGPGMARDGEAVMTGDFRCLTLDRHVFEERS